MQGDQAAETVLLIHGIWMKGLEFLPLRRRLAEAGYTPRVFRYASLARTPAQNADRLADFIARLGLPRLHLVAHSLGGILTLHLFARHGGIPPGRVVFIGAPVAGSAVARRLALSGPGAWLLGHSREQGLTGGAPEWTAGRELGVISGDLAIGVGRVLGGLTGPNDGTVAVAETRVEAATDSVLIHASHLGLLFSRRTADAVADFLRHGRFGAHWPPPQ